jgi:hypothetical protein
MTQFPNLTNSLNPIQSSDKSDPLRPFRNASDSPAGRLLTAVLCLVLAGSLSAAPVSRATAEQVALNFTGTAFGTARVCTTWCYENLDSGPAAYAVELAVRPVPGTERVYTVLVSADDIGYPVLECRLSSALARRAEPLCRRLAARNLGPNPVHRRTVFLAPWDLWLEFSGPGGTTFVSPSARQTITRSELQALASAQNPRPDKERVAAEWQRWLAPPAQPDLRRSWIPGVPDYDWHYGCAPTAAGNVLAYWDQRGYPRLVDRVWYNRYDPLEEDYDSVPNCNLELAIAMGTDTTRGGTYVDSIAPGLTRVCNSPAFGNHYLFQAFTRKDDQNLLLREIDAGRPGVLCLLRHRYYGNHAVAFIGWGPPDTNWVCIHDGWSTGSQPDTVISYYWALGLHYVTAVHPGGMGGADVGIARVRLPTGVVLPTTVTPCVLVRNFGTGTRTFRVSIDIANSYHDAQTVTNLNAGDTLPVAFRSWTPPGPGLYNLTCSTALDQDIAPFNNVVHARFRVDTLLPQAWTGLADLPSGPTDCRVRQGGALAAAAGEVFAFKGGGTNEFLGYSRATGLWNTLETIPAHDAQGRRHYVRAGAALASDGQALYALKGGKTFDFWRYDIPTRTWTRLPDVPHSGQPVKTGSGLTALRLGDTTFVFLLKGGRTLEFLRYNTVRGTWQNLDAVPGSGASAAFKDGTCLASDRRHKVYALKAHSNEFAAYDILSRTWEARSALPVSGYCGQKARVRAGAALCSDDAGVLYCLKGGNSREFWAYDPTSDAWFQQEDFPLSGNKGVKTGGALASDGRRVYALRGNSTRDFYITLPEPALDAGRLIGPEQTVDAALKAPALCASRAQLSLAPNPAHGNVRLTCRLAGTSTRIELYDITGNLCRSVPLTGRPGFETSIELPTAGLSRGIYIVRLGTADAPSAKLIIE